MKTHDIDAVTRDLNPAPTTDVSADAWSQLSDGITSSVATEQKVLSLDTRRRPARPRVALVAAAGLLIVGVVAAALINRPGDVRIEALSFTDQGGKLIVRVVDPAADPKQYNAEFRKMGLDVTVKAVPVSPPFVGTIVSYSARDSKEMDQVRRLEPGEKCNGTLTAADPGCQEGLELPKNYKGETEIQFGRAARPGEMYWHSSSSATYKGESLAGLKIENKTVGQVLPMIEARGVKVVAYYDIRDTPQFDDIGKPADNWYVHDASAFAPGEVTLFTGPKPAK
jgi:hypothetical protein